MTDTCAQWKDPLLEAALTEAVSDKLSHHLSQCRGCAAKLDALRARKQRLDSLLPLVARGAEPSSDLSVRIIAAAEASETQYRPHFWRNWALAGAAALIAIVAVVLSGHRPSGLTEMELRQAQALAQWQAPTDVLLQTPGQEFLNSTPKLGESYLPMPGASQRLKR